MTVKMMFPRGAAGDDAEHASTPCHVTQLTTYTQAPVTGTGTTCDCYDSNHIFSASSQFRTLKLVWSPGLVSD